MARNGVEGSYLTNLSQRDTKPFNLVYADIGEIDTENPLRITDAGQYININSDTSGIDPLLNGEYIPQSNLLAVSTIDEDANFQIGEVTLTLSGVNGAAISLLLGNPYLDRSVKIWRGLFSPENNVVGDPILIFNGRISAVSIDDDPEQGKSTVSVVVSSQWVDFDRRNGNKTNDTEQQFRFYGDKGLEFAAKSIRNLEWGRSRRG